MEAWREGRLVGGLYGVAIVGLFAGESMCHRETVASKVAPVGLVDLPLPAAFAGRRQAVTGVGRPSLGTLAGMRDERAEAIQAAVDRITSWQDGATEGTVEAELPKGFAAAGVDLSDDDVRTLAEAI